MADQPALELREVLPNGTRYFWVCMPRRGRTTGRASRQNITDTDLLALVAGGDADLICVGHTHWPFDRQIPSINVINLGSVSNPLPPDLRASYVMIQADRSGYQVSHRRVDYDHEAVVVALQRLHHPGAEFIIKHMRGERQPRWNASTYPLPGV